MKIPDAHMKEIIKLTESLISTVANHEIAEQFPQMRVIAICRLMSFYLTSDYSLEEYKQLLPLLIKNVTANVERAHKLMEEEGYGK